MVFVWWEIIPTESEEEAIVREFKKHFALPPKVNSHYVVLSILTKVTKRTICYYIFNLIFQVKGRSVDYYKVKLLSKMCAIEEVEAKSNPTVTD